MLGRPHIHGLATQWLGVGLLICLVGLIFMAWFGVGLLICLVGLIFMA